MLKHLRITNFKSLQDVFMRIRDLNVLIGPNNSGKTSVLQTLALLKQSVEELNFNGYLVRLGDFMETVFEHNLRERIQISFLFSPAVIESYFQDRADVSSSEAPDKEHFMSSLFQCQVTIAGREDGSPFIEETRIMDSNGRTIFGAAPREHKISPRQEFEGVGFSVQGFLPFPVSGPAPALGKASRFSEHILQEFREFLHYVSSKRGLDRRAEPVDENYSRRPHDVGVFGESAIPLLAYIRDDDNYAEVNKRIGVWLEKFGLADLVASITDGPAYLLNAKNRQTGIRSNVVDLGFGLNQLIPIIVQCFYAPKGSLIMLEQPEAHLHPRAQAEVADFLIDVIDYGNRVIVETHSEHLLLRLQRRVAERMVDPDRINICYFEQTDKSTEVTQITINGNGYFSEPLPQGFFEEGFQEAVAHLKALKPQGDPPEHV